MTDKFLNNKFTWYGLDVINYYSIPYKERTHPQMGIRLVLQTSIMIYFLAARNPMCSVFPTVTSCNIPNVGAAGGEQMHNGLCVLTQVKLHCIAGVLFTCLALEYHQ